MKYVLSAALLLSCGSAMAQASSPDYPSCDLAQQRALVAPTGGRLQDPRQAHVSMRTNILQADISSARTARLLTQEQAQRLSRQAEAVRRQADRLVAKQGWLSAAEVASEDRRLNALALKFCRAPRAGASHLPPKA